MMKSMFPLAICALVVALLAVPSVGEGTRGSVKKGKDGKKGGKRSKHCSKAIRDHTEAVNQITQDRFLSINGRLAPNLEQPLVAYAHEVHCEAVVAQAGEEIDITELCSLGKAKQSDASQQDLADLADCALRKKEMDEMHLAHCFRVVNNVETEFIAENDTLDGEGCALQFPRSQGSSEGVAKAGISFDYSAYFSYQGYGDVTVNSLTPQPVETVASLNFAAVLMKIHRGEVLSNAEELYKASMNSKKAVSLAAKAYGCMRLGAPKAAADAPK